MTTHEIAARLSARASREGKWIARCPAHDDGRPSLSIAEGQDGRTLLHCFTGCDAKDVLKAVGLSLPDLFEKQAAPYALRSRTQARAVDLYEALGIEERRYRERHGIEGLLRASEINAIRATVAKRYSIELAPILRPLWEGAYGGRERDVAWPAIFDWALFVASVRVLGAPTAFDGTLLPPTAVLTEAEDLAADAMRSLERDAASRSK